MTNSKIDADYVSTLTDAVLTHAACKKNHGRLRDVLQNMQLEKIPQPTDWQFHYTGAIELRWHNGDEHLSTSTKSMSLTIFESSYNISGDFSTDPSKYRSESRSNVQGLTELDSAIQLLKIFVPMVLFFPSIKKGAT
jgi:hypothetical protein